MAAPDILLLKIRFSENPWRYILGVLGGEGHANACAMYGSLEMLTPVLTLTENPNFSLPPPLTFCIALHCKCRNLLISAFPDWLITEPQSN